MRSIFTVYVRSRNRSSATKLWCLGYSDDSRSSAQSDRRPKTVGQRAREEADIRRVDQSGRIEAGRHVGFRRDARPVHRHVNLETLWVQQRRGVVTVLERHDRSVQRSLSLAQEHIGQHGTGGPSRNIALIRNDR